MTQIFLKNFQCAVGKDTKNCLVMSDSNGRLGVNDLESAVDSGQTVSWELVEDSGIKKITKIQLKGTKTKIFKKDPEAVPGRNKFETDVVETKVELRGAYLIEYVLEGGGKVTIDPYIKVLPPD
jgi:hypothetical protein